MNEEEIRKSIEAFHKRPVPRYFTPEIISQIPDVQLDEDVVNFVLTKLTDHQTVVRDLAALPKGFQVVYSTWLLEAEVNNGGFNQYFFNHSIELAELALLSLPLINAQEYANVLRRAMEIHKREEENPALRDLYEQQTLESFFETYKFSGLGECDEAFVQLNDQLPQLRLAYIRSNPEAFVGA